MKKRYWLTPVVVALGVYAGTALAAQLANLSGQSCGNSTGTWHFVNNQTGGAAAGTPNATRSSANSCSVSASWCFTTPAFLLHQCRPARCSAPHAPTGPSGAVRLQLWRQGARLRSESRGIAKCDSRRSKTTHRLRLAPVPATRTTCRVNDRHVVCPTNGSACRHEPAPHDPENAPMRSNPSNVQIGPSWLADRVRSDDKQNHRLPKRAKPAGLHPIF